MVHALSDDLLPMTTIIGCGVLGHVLFNRLEPRNLPGIFSLLIAPPAILASLFHLSYTRSLSAFLFSYVIFLASLIFSVVAYRLSPFHPLAHFPGPIPCKITRIWAWYIAYSGNQHRYYQALHSRYGTHVRTGPNHLHICDAEAIPTVLGPKGFPRGDRYKSTKTSTSKDASLLGITELHDHAPRRKIWNRSLNTSAIQGYQDSIASRIAQLTRALEKQDGKVDLSAWCSFFAFDSMGDLFFGGAFQLMERGGDVGGSMNMAHNGVKYQELAGIVPWIRPFLALFPFKEMVRNREFATESVLARKARGCTRKDIFYYLLDEEGLGSPLPMPTLIMEASLGLVAGSDTTATALANIFYYLLSNPEAFRGLQAEVDNALLSGSDIFASTTIREMKFLNAVINETLRLQPAVPSGVQRLVSPELPGVMIAGRWVPASTTVQIPTYTVHRDPRYFFPEPDSFRPERWLCEQEKSSFLDISAYFPFSYGPMNCVGKNLALLELRMATCSLLQKFDFQFAPGWDPREWEQNLGDTFVLTKGRMPVLLKPRK